MSNVSYEKLYRVTGRAVGIAKDEEAPDLIGAVAPPLVKAAELFFGAYAANKAAEDDTRREIGEATEAITDLARGYDGARAAVLGNQVQDAVGPAAVKCTTPDDLLREAEQVEEILLERRDEPWAHALLPAYSSAIERAQKEWSEGLLAQTKLQKAQGVLREAAEKVNRALVDFRRMVRVVYGMKSKQYHLIRAQRGTARNGDDETDAASAPASATKAVEVKAPDAK
jgi:hypothetical protein